MISQKENRSWTFAATVVWILLWAGCSGGSLGLSLIGQLNRTGCLILLVPGVLGSILGYYFLNGRSFKVRGFRWKRFRKPLPLLYLICALAALIGGAIHPPTNYDALCYRIPRLLHWLAEGHWHWIRGIDPRMNFSAAGFEAMMLPPLGALHTLRLAYLINAFSFLLLPGLVFMVFTALGVRHSIAARWMWLLPCGSCFVMEAGSIGNDLPGCALVLAALMFALRAARRASAQDTMLAVLSAALMTGLKASNIPLLLPIVIGLAAAFLKHPLLMKPAALAAVIALPVSYLPIAAVNSLHSGVWTGHPESIVALRNPHAGLAGNTILISSAAIVPAVFPPAESLNNAFNTKVVPASLRWLKDDFPDFRMTHPQLATEEHSGLGLGVTAALLACVACAWKSLRPRRLLGTGGLVAAGFWVALLFFMTKLGSCGTPRLAAPYYAGLLLPPLLMMHSGIRLKRKWWMVLSIVSILPILPALACNPARPLLPMTSIIQTLRSHEIDTKALSRMETVYQTYATRSDIFKSVRELLPSDSKVIGFAGTSGDPQYSFWLPLGERRVVDFTPSADRRPPDPSGLDVIVASEWGCQDRFGMTPRQLADHLDWEIRETASVRALASAGPVAWSILLPKALASEKHIHTQ
jgi:hypothetical protein